MARTQTQVDLNYKASQVGGAGVRWSIIGLVATLLCVGLMAWSGLQKEKQARGSLAMAMLSSRLASASDAIALDPVELVRALQVSQQEIQQAGLSIPEPTRAALAKVAEQSTSLSGDAASLKALSASQQQFDQSLVDVTSATGAVRARSGLMGGQWGQALLSSMTELTRPELSSLPATFAPSAASEGVQRQWASRFASVSADLLRLPPIARKDTSLSEDDRAAIGALSTAAKSLADSSQALANGAALRARLANASRLVAPLAATGATAIQVPVANPLWKTLGWVAMGLGFLALVSWIMVLRNTLAARSLAQDVSEESRHSVRQVDAVDRLMRQIQKVAPGDGPVHAGLHIEEAPSSPFFPIATGFNRLVEAINGFQRRARDTSSELDYSLNPILEGANEVNTLQQRQIMSVEEMEQSGMTNAAQAAQAASRAQQLSQDSRAIQESAWRTGAMLQERGFRMDELRSTNQDIAKRLKRLGESSQGVSLAADRSHQISQQLKVISINIAIEASSDGESGQIFASMAQEVQRLAVAGNEIAQEIDGLVELLLSDASEVASTMEANTAEVVASGQLSERAEAAVKEIERISQPIASELGVLVSHLESLALSLADSASRNGLSKREAEQGQAAASKLQEGLAQLRLNIRSLARDAE